MNTVPGTAVQITGYTGYSSALLEAVILHFAACESYFFGRIKIVSDAEVKSREQGELVDRSS